MAQKTLVVDASVVIKWYFEEEGSNFAREIYTAFKDHGINIAVPSLLYYEVTNAVRYIKIGSGEKADIIKTLLALRLETAMPTEKVFLSSLELAETYDATVYDCTYLALAKVLGCKYITADADFCKKVKKDVVPLDQWRNALYTHERSE